MIVLAVDTASKSSSVALLDEKSVLAETTLVNSETHSKHLMNMIDEVMGKAAIRVPQVDLFAVTVGPGSFTGVRIGISAIKGLAFAFAKKVAGVSTLDALAEPFVDQDGLICPMLDARRGEVYFSRYRAGRGELKKEAAEQALPPAEAIAGIKAPCLFVGDGAVVYQREIAVALRDRALFGPLDRNVIRASVVGRLAIRQFNLNQMLTAAELVPCYLRKSDAETLFSKR